LDNKQFSRRVWAVVLILALMLSFLGSALYDLQINNGEEYYLSAHSKIAETQTVEAARGRILDRNGQVLVSNRSVYQVTLEPTIMGDERNDILLELIRAARDSEVEWADSLPITDTKPFAFTTDAPYYTVTENEDGTQTASLTKLGKLCVKMKWIQDPNKKKAPIAELPEPEEPGFFEQLKTFLFGEAPVEDTIVDLPEETEYKLPTAEELLGKMCRSFGLAGEGAVDEKAAAQTGEPIPTLNIGNLPARDARAVAGVLYELYLRSKEISSWPPYVFAEDVDIDFISRVKELSLNGVIIEATTVRQYHTPYAAHLLGRVGLMNEQEVEYYTNLDADGDGVADYNQNDTVGKEGVELAFESYLRGVAGVRAVERNTNGKIVSEEWLSEPEPGDNVVLTLDIGLQAQVENTLAAGLPNLESKESEGAACVVLDVNTAEVLAAASYPTFDLSTYSADYSENAGNPLKPFLNRALNGTYAPGSTFKMVTAVAALEEEIITPRTQIRDEGRYTYYPGTAPQCWIYRQKGRTHGLQTVSEAIMNSCNYFFFEVGRQLGITRLTDYATRFGLGQKTGLELSEKAGVMAGPEYTKSMGGTWYDGSTLSVAIGQESSQFTPIQLANYIATLVNGGTRNATHLLKEVKSSDFSQILHTYSAEPLSTIEISDKNLDAVKAGMLMLTTEGSVAKYFRGLDVKVGAKTGSAQVSADSESNAVFVCFAPYEAPEIAIAMVVEHGGGGSDLGALAADILSYYFSAQETREEVLTENTLVR